MVEYMTSRPERLRRVREVLCIAESRFNGSPHFPVRYGKNSGLSVPTTRYGHPACSVERDDLVLLVFSSTDPPRAYVFERPAREPELLAWRVAVRKPAPPAHVLWVWHFPGGMALYVYTTPDLLRRRAEALRRLSRVTAAITGEGEDKLWLAEAEAAELWASVIENGGWRLPGEDGGGM